MNAVRAADQADRDYYLSDVVSLTVGSAGLSHRNEQAIREAAMRLLVPILEAADSLVAAGVELEAIDRRLDTHVRQLHPKCSTERPCWGYRVLQIRRRRLQRQWDQQFRRLAGGAR